MKFSKTHYMLPILGLLMASCLTNSQERNQSDQLLLTLEFEGINEPIAADGDTIRIVQVRFLYGRTSLQNTNGDTLLINENPRQVNHQFGTDPVKGLASGTFNSNVTFSTLAFEIKQAEESDGGTGSNFDTSSFIEGSADDQRYSIIINGSYNDNSFEYKSTRNYNYSFQIQNDTGGSAESLLYNLPMTSISSSWFTNNSGEGLLDPRQTNNANTINDNIEESLTIN